MTAESVSDRESVRTPDSPTDLPPQGWVATLKRTAREFSDDNLTDWAAALTYYDSAPNVKHPRFRLGHAGRDRGRRRVDRRLGRVRVLRGERRRLQQDYGSLGAMIVFLVWLWLTNLAILFGAELNSELERSRQMAEDPSVADHEPFMPARHEPKAWADRRDRRPARARRRPRGARRDAAVVLRHGPRVALGCGQPPCSRP